MFRHPRSQHMDCLDALIEQATWVDQTMLYVVLRVSKPSQADGRSWASGPKRVVHLIRRLLRRLLIPNTGISSFFGWFFIFPAFHLKKSRSQKRNPFAVPASQLGVPLLPRCHTGTGRFQNRAADPSCTAQRNSFHLRRKSANTACINTLAAARCRPALVVPSPPYITGRRITRSYQRLLSSYR